MKREMITLEELEGKLRGSGVERVADVRVARLESDGHLSVFTTNSAPRPRTAPDEEDPHRQ